MLEKRLILALTRCAICAILLPVVLLLCSCVTRNTQPGTLLFRPNFQLKILLKRIALHFVPGELRTSAVGAFRLCRSGMPSALMSF